MGEMVRVDGEQRDLLSRCCIVGERPGVQFEAAAVQVLFVSVSVKVNILGLKCGAN